MTQQPKANYTQVPNVFIDRCALTGEIRDFFTCLLRHVWNTGGVYTGSTRELAGLLNLSKDKTNRSVQVLDGAHLLKAERCKLSVRLEDLWELNDFYNAGGNVPYWTDLDKALLVANLRQNEEDKESGLSQECDRLSQICDNVVSDLRQSVSKVRQSVSSLRQAKKGVKPAVEPSKEEKQEPPKKNKNIKTITNTSKKEGGAKASPSSAPTTKSNNKIVSIENQKAKRTQNTQPPQVVLSQEEQAVYDLYCTLFHVITNKPPLSEKVKEQCAILAPHVKTQEDIISIDKYAREHTKGRPQKMHLGNLVTNLDGWIVDIKKPHNDPSSTSTQAHHIMQTAAAVEEKPLNETPEQSLENKRAKRLAAFIKNNPVVFWTTTKDVNTIKTVDKQPLEVLLTWKEMYVQEAIEQYGLTPLDYAYVPPRKNSLLSRIAVLSKQIVNA